eukprot:6364488-Pyramimonas_sp.AAC.1
MKAHVCDVRKPLLSAAEMPSAWTSTSALTGRRERSPSMPRPAPRHARAPTRGAAGRLDRKTRRGHDEAAA